MDRDGYGWIGMVIMDGWMDRDRMDRDGWMDRDGYGWIGMVMDG